MQPHQLCSVQSNFQFLNYQIKFISFKEARTQVTGNKSFKDQHDIVKELNNIKVQTTA